MLVCVEKRAKLVLQGRSRLERESQRCLEVLRSRLARPLPPPLLLLLLLCSAVCAAAAALVAFHCCLTRLLLPLPPTRYRLFTTTTRETFIL